MCLSNLALSYQLRGSNNACRAIYLHQTDAIRNLSLVALSPYHMHCLMVAFLGKRMYALYFPKYPNDYNQFSFRFRKQQTQF